MHERHHFALARVTGLIKPRVWRLIWATNPCSRVPCGGVSKTAVTFSEVAADDLVASNRDGRKKHMEEILAPKLPRQKRADARQKKRADARQKNVLAASETNDATKTGKPPPRTARLHPSLPPDSLRSPFPLHSDSNRARRFWCSAVCAFWVALRVASAGAGVEGRESGRLFSRVPRFRLGVGPWEERRGPQRPSMAERRTIYREPRKPRRRPRSQGYVLLSLPVLLTQS